MLVAACHLRVRSLATGRLREKALRSCWRLGKLARSHILPVQARLHKTTATRATATATTTTTRAATRDPPHSFTSILGLINSRWACEQPVECNCARGSARSDEPRARPGELQVLQSVCWPLERLRGLGKLAGCCIDSARPPILLAHLLHVRASNRISAPRVLCGQLIKHALAGGRARARMSGEAPLIYGHVRLITFQALRASAGR